MRLLDAYARLLAMQQPVMRTGDAAVCLGIDRAHASKILARLAETGPLIRLAHGLWALAGRVWPMSMPGYLTDPAPSYISLQSALYHHGMISQIPAVMYAVSVARTRRYDTPLGVVSIHHVEPSFFCGFETMHGRDANLATPEKALIDFFYFRPARSHLFADLPELEIPRRFQFGRARGFLARIRSPQRRALVSRLLDSVTNSHGRSRPPRP